jgi:hypothetical protein
VNNLKRLAGTALAVVALPPPSHRPRMRPPSIATLLTLASTDLPRWQLRRLLGERVVRITVKPCMDMSTMIEERLVQCCFMSGRVHRSTNAHRSALLPWCGQVVSSPALGSPAAVSSSSVGNRSETSPAKVSGSSSTRLTVTCTGTQSAS